ncbi:MAG: hypothetical protein R8K49_00870 [Mariprofundaceae bacterium]
MEVKLQEAMDQFLMSLDETSLVKREHAEQCLEFFADYIVHYSDLFHDEIEVDEVNLDDWEAALEGYMEKLFDGDMEAVAELGPLPLNELEAEHIRDFLAWYLLREPNIDSLALEKFAKVLKVWIDYMLQKTWLDSSRGLGFLEMLEDVVAESSRAAQAAHLLLYFVRLGAGVSPRLRGKHFEAFVEGHARVDRMEEAEKHVWLGFDNQDKIIGPVKLPLEIMSYLRTGDVLDVEMGQRGGQWIIVDIGPVYPACVYVEADELKVPNKQM